LKKRKKYSHVNQWSLSINTHPHHILLTISFESSGQGENRRRGGKMEEVVVMYLQLGYEGKIAFFRVMP
jgi:hypothetical protein